MVIFIVLSVYSVFFRGACVSPHNTTTTQNCTTLQPSTSTHTHKHTLYNKKQKHFKTKTHKHSRAQRNHALCISLPAGFTILLYVNRFSFFLSECHLCIVLCFIALCFCICLIRVYVYIHVLLLLFSVS